MTHEELKEMVIILKENAFKSHNDTAILNVKVENFSFVMDKVLEVLDKHIGGMKNDRITRAGRTEKEN